MHIASNTSWFIFSIFVLLFIEIDLHYTLEIQNNLHDFTIKCPRDGEGAFMISRFTVEIPVHSKLREADEKWNGKCVSEWVSTLMKRAQYVTSASPSLSLYLIYIMVKNQCDIIATRIQLIYRAQCILISPRYIRSQSCSLGRIVNFLDTTRIPPKT